ncbi:Hypothetical predicted protein [Podarcis lilfordi]|uniref:Uncharacterized protein n=1 Tax=Podarcis lilfordi TaxID=74358 RepID=A0AA35PBK0_9SAUR|nr:Hypothetical predicted protein [Podarcis lilfordi]
MGRKTKLPSRTKKMNLTRLLKLLENSNPTNPANPVLPPLDKSRSPCPNKNLHKAGFFNSTEELHKARLHNSTEQLALPNGTAGKSRENPIPKQETTPKTTYSRRNLILNKQKLIILPVYMHKDLLSPAQQRIYILKKTELAVRGFVPAENIINVKFLPSDKDLNRVVVTFRDWHTTKLVSDNKDKLQRVELQVTHLFEVSGTPTPLIETIKTDKIKTKPSMSMTDENCKMLQLEADKAPNQLAKRPKTLSPYYVPDESSNIEKENRFIATIEQIHKAQDALIERLASIRKSITLLATPVTREFYYATYTTKPLSNSEWTLRLFLSPEELGPTEPPITKKTITHQAEIAVPPGKNSSIFVDNLGALDTIHTH